LFKRDKKDRKTFLIYRKTNKTMERKERKEKEQTLENYIQRKKKTKWRKTGLFIIIGKTFHFL
jgi:hypothetical protein